LDDDNAEGMVDAMGVATDKRIAPQEGRRETPIVGEVECLAGASCQGPITPMGEYLPHRKGKSWFP